MNINDIENELEKFQNVQYRMDAEGFHYAFESYSSYEEIHDDNFHELRLAYIKASRELASYVNDTVDRLTEKLENAEE
jgi:hypothetical protein